MSAWDAFEALVAPAGLNLVGVVDPREYDAAVPEARRTRALHPSTRGIVVLASGGPHLWDAFQAEVRRNEAALTSERHPLDAYVRRTVDAADHALGPVDRRWFFAGEDAELHLDFQVLGGLSGLGTRSRLGLLLHPTYGPWIGLRAACFLAERVPRRPSEAFDACLACPGHCAAACPGGAFPGGPWDVDRCSEFHRTDVRCESSCDARAACPVGREHAYSEEERVYHYNRLEGRHRLRVTLGIPDGADRWEGEGPHWGDWRDRVDVKGAASKGR